MEAESGKAGCNPGVFPAAGFFLICLPVLWLRYHQLFLGSVSVRLVIHTIPVHFTNTVFATYVGKTEELSCIRTTWQAHPIIQPMNMIIHKITDPSGYEIHFSEELCREGGRQNGRCEELKQVLEAPACIIELPTRQRCYFRSLAWNITVLIQVAYGGQQWSVVSWRRNPGQEYVQELLLQGNFIACNSLD